ncbi:DUF1294 domain-containing protein [Pseudalkalibacillus berkeleyi]|uniref:DUF1294 domain-containing protein n=1 Tax=Pseudalkalibacillus berkeleyi TaxID=1069813 RepID=A0ABS9GZK3_9BACL|nr:DUF1294 domain-containing protein [Pseudalkalibacillus berkeleyi]MCF6138178.1 DUF1294 domain-containing protein [Pseudalkalibacillus berkeleyi]
MILLSVLIVLNLYGIIIMFVDKRKAQRQQWRISEGHLWIVAIIGGAVGIFLGMRMFRHKTKHASFKYGVPMIIAFQAIGILYWYVY